MTKSSPSEPEPKAGPPPCPGCGSVKGFTRVGKFRSQCTNCNSLLTNSEIGRDDRDPQ